MDKQITITFIRSGMTESGSEGRYVGVVDEPLLEESKKKIRKRVENGVYPKVSRVYTSTQHRCLETSYIIYPKIPAIATSELSAFDYGEYAGRTYYELVKDERFQADAKGKGNITYPGGENTYTFHARTSRGFQKILAEIDGTNVTDVAIISHKETILPILRRYSIPRSLYTEYPLDFGGGVTVSYSANTGMGRILNFF